MTELARFPGASRGGVIKATKRGFWGRETKSQKKTKKTKKQKKKSP
jgi:hypothetical protein